MNPNEVPQNLTEGEELKINGERYTVLDTYTSNYTTSSVKRVSIRLKKEGCSGPSVRTDMTHKVKAVMHTDDDADERERVVIQELLRPGSSYRPDEWSDEEKVVTLHCVTRAATAPLTQVEEGDKIRFNGRKRPLVVTSAKTVECSSSMGSRQGEVTIVECEGDWDGAASYKLKRYDNQIRAYYRDKKGNGDQARVERLQKDHRACMKYLKDDDLRSVVIVEESENEEPEKVPTSANEPDEDDMDDLVDENAIGSLQTGVIALEDGEEKIKSALKSLGVDRRTAMPDDEECAEYRLRAALQEISDVTDELADHAGESYSRR